MRESVKEKKVQKRYDEEFKRQAVELVFTAAEARESAKIQLPLQNVAKPDQERNGINGDPRKVGRRPLPGSAPDSSKGAPTDPDAPVSGIRFLGFTVLLPATIRHCRVNTFVNDSEFIPCFPVAAP